MAPRMPFMTRRHYRFQIKPCHSRYNVEADLSLNTYWLERDGVSAAYKAVCTNAKTNSSPRRNSSV